MELAQAHTNIKERDLPEDNELFLTSLLDTEKIKSVLEENNADMSEKIVSCKIEHVRYTPGVSCIVGCLVTYKSDESNDKFKEAPIYVKCYEKSKFEQIAKIASNKNLVSGSICQSPLIIPDINAVINEFPNDERIPGLPLIANMDDLWKMIRGSGKSIFPDGWDVEKNTTVSYKIRYKPESRYVARCDSVLINKRNHERKVFQALLRIEKSRDTTPVFEFMQRLHLALAQNKFLKVPKPLFYCSEKNVEIHEWTDALKFSELLRGEEALQRVASAAKALSLIHQYQDDSLPILDLTQYSRRIKKVSGLLGCAGEEIKRESAEICMQLLRLIETPPFGQFGLVHGDFHQGQILCEKDKNVFLDFANVSNGETVADVGSFLAQMTFLKLRGRLQSNQNLDSEFLDSYKRANAVAFPDQRLKFWITIFLLELAAREFRRLKPGWPIMARKLLQECRSSLNSQGAVCQ